VTGWNRPGPSGEGEPYFENDIWKTLGRDALALEHRPLVSSGKPTVWPAARYPLPGSDRRIGSRLNGNTAIGRIFRHPGGKLVAERMTTKEDELRRVPLFSKLGKRSLKEIGRIADVVTRPAGEVLVKEGALGFDFLMILDGQARAEQCGKVIGRLAQDDFFGEVSLIAHRPGPATITAETAVRLLVVEPGYFEDLLEQVPDLWKEIAIALCEYIPDACDFPLDLETTPTAR
jgi:hypothetical protein